LGTAVRVRGAGEVILPADAQYETAVESDRLPLLLEPEGGVVSDRLAVVVDLRTPEQLVIDLREEAAEPRLLIPEEGLLGAAGWQRAVKRLGDVLVGGLLLVGLSPVLLTAALLVVLSSRGPVFFAQERAGLQGRRFRFLKFRTMVCDAEARRCELEAHNEVDGPVFKIRRDPRITRVGRVLRKLSVDEVPQLLHVLSGKMSLIGPRPLPVGEAAGLSPWEAQRLLVKPGLTCIWQVSGRSDLDFRTWARMDIDYIRDWSLWLDLKLLLRTVPAVLSGRGAY
jgi:lipopolysaccharide/colanic/teichoic acid biosynthesis glycosyltransferase